jgi:high affinity Mn2+ porin
MFRRRRLAASDGRFVLAVGGNGAPSYGPEKAMETHYDFKIWKYIHGAVACQFIVDPAFNQDRGPVSVFGARLAWVF